LPRYRTRNRTDFIVVHCSDTSPTMEGIDAAEIRRWHTAKGWTDIGYHYVIKRDGVREPGRPLHVWGAHVEGMNAVSVGICMVGGRHGEFDFNRKQLDMLDVTLLELTQEYPNAIVLGHRDLDARKTCPGFNVQEYWYGRDVRGGGG